MTAFETTPKRPNYNLNFNCRSLKIFLWLAVTRHFVCGIYMKQYALPR